MLSKVFSSGLMGLDAYRIEIEVDIARGLPSITIVGLPDNAVKESRERVKSAIKNSGFDYPTDRITVNLAPSDIKKEGSAFDLPIALGILASSKQINPEKLKDYIILGELSLSGEARPIKGALPIALAISQTKFSKIILPKENTTEAAIVENIQVYPVKTLPQIINFIDEPSILKPIKVDVKELFRNSIAYDIDFADVEGQAQAKRGLEVAVAGAHNIILIGPPGSGKSMLTKRIPTIMPDMSLEEALETTKIHSILGMVPAKTGIIATHPFRSPHHTSSDVAIVGGGQFPRPGEISLAHNGVLFLDELPEFHRNVLETLRQPLEDGFVNISRAAKSMKFPSRFMLACAMNPCPCGYFTDPKKQCRCSSTKIQNYLSKISGPLLDRIDIHIEVHSLRHKELMAKQKCETSEEIKKRINKARKVQRDRFSAEGARLPDGQGSASGGKGDSTFSNAQMNHKQIKKYCQTNEECEELLKMAMDEFSFSARAYDKILKVSRTIADLAEKEKISPEHISEAIQYRSLDRNLWI